MKITVFGGPTISEQEVKEIVKADYLPPVRHSDVVSLVRNDKPDVIVIFDGEIISYPTVWHNEIIEALNCGVKVYGAAGIGALRAVELHNFGMIGIGKIFAQYRDKLLEADSEVFVKYDRQGNSFVPLSKPMVNFRATFKAALSGNLIKEDEHEALLNAAGSLNFEERTFENISLNLQKENLDPVSLEKLEKIMQEHYIDLQKEDAIETLQVVNRLTLKDIQTPLPSKNEYDLFFNAMYERDRKVKGKNIDIPLYILSNFISLRHPQMEDVNSNALNREITLLFAEVMKIEPSEQDITKERLRFKKRFSLVSAKAFNEWLEKNDQSEAEFSRLMEDQAKIRKAQMWYSIRLGFAKNTKYLLDALKLNNTYVEWKEKCEDFHEEVLQYYPEILEQANEEDQESLLRDFSKNTKIPWNTSTKHFIEEILMDEDTLHLELTKDKVVKNKLAAMIRDFIKF